MISYKRTIKRAILLTIITILSVPATWVLAAPDKGGTFSPSDSGYQTIYQSNNINKHTGMSLLPPLRKSEANSNLQIASATSSENERKSLIPNYLVEQHIQNYGSEHSKVKNSHVQNTTTQNPAHFPESQFPVTQNPGYPASQHLVHSAVQYPNPNHPANQHLVHSAAQYPNYSANQHLVHSAVQYPNPNHPASRYPLHTATQYPGHPTFQHPVQSASRYPTSQYPTSPFSNSNYTASQNQNPNSQIPGSRQPTSQSSGPQINTAIKTDHKTTYKVQKGDTLYRIANFFDTTVDLLMVQNGITDPTKLQIGHELIIPTRQEELTNWLASSHEVSQVFLATLTAYTAGYESTGKTPSHPEYGITASGARVKENHTIAVDPDVIPLGTLVYIEGIGIRKAEDTGSAIKGHKIDVYIPDLEEALKFGVKKNVKVYVLGNTKNTM